MFKSITMKKNIKVDVLPEDFIEGYSHKDYNNAYACPLAKALRRAFKVDRASVWCKNKKESTGTAYVNGNIYVYKDWNFRISKNVKDSYDKGDKTIYYVELTLT